jgi:hypothetical protein
MMGESGDEPRKSKPPPAPELPPAWTKPAEPWPASEPPRPPKTPGQQLVGCLGSVVIGFLVVVGLLFGSCLLLVAVNQH